jgi:hypothetical protein
VIDTYQSIPLVVGLMRKNLTQEVAGEIFGVSQSTVSRRWDLLRPVIRRAVAGFIPDPRLVPGWNRPGGRHDLPYLGLETYS